MNVNDVMEHHKSVMKSLDKKLKKGELSQDEYDERVAKQETNTKEKLKDAMPSSNERDILFLMKAGG